MCFFYTVHWSFWLIWIQCGLSQKIQWNGKRAGQGFTLREVTLAILQGAWKDQNKVFCHLVFLNFGPFSVKSGMCGWCMSGRLPRTAQQPLKKTLNPLLCRFLFNVFYRYIRAPFWNDFGALWLADWAHFDFSKPLWLADWYPWWFPKSFCDWIISQRDEIWLAVGMGGICLSLLTPYHTTQWRFLTALKGNALENNRRKGDNAGYQHFLLFPQCFLPCQK